MVQPLDLKYCSCMWVSIFKLKFQLSLAYLKVAFGVVDITTIYENGHGQKHIHVQIFLIFMSIQQTYLVVYLFTFVMGVNVSKSSFESLNNCNFLRLKCRNHTSIIQFLSCAFCCIYCFILLALCQPLVRACPMKPLVRGNWIYTFLCFLLYLSCAFCRISCFLLVD